jgi:hypothetical protein
MNYSKYIFISFVLTIIFNTVLTTYGYSALPWAGSVTSTLQETDTWLFDVAKWLCMACFIIFGIRTVFFKGGWLFTIIPLAGYGLISARKVLFDWAGSIFGG